MGLELMTLRLLAGWSAVLLVSMTTANAADLRVPVSSQAPHDVPGVYNWTGLYLGAHGGFGWSRQHSIDIDTGESFRIDNDGAIFGAHIGLNYQTGQMILGLEADASWSDVEGSRLVGDDLGNVQIKWLGTVTGRVGMAFDNILLYGKGGFAWAKEKFNGIDVTGATLPVPASATRAGWTAGAGLEWALFDRWTAKVEYNYVDFGTDTISFIDTAGVPDPAGNSEKVHLLKFGFNHQIGPRPVVARY